MKLTRLALLISISIVPRLALAQIAPPPTPPTDLSPVVDAIHDQTNAINAPVPGCGATPCTNHIGAVDQGAAGAAAWLTNPKPSTSNGTTTFDIASAASTNSQVIVSGAHTLLWLLPESTSDTAMSVRFYDTGSAPTCSSATNYKFSVIIPPRASAPLVGGVVPNFGPYGVDFAAGIAACITGGPANNDNTAATTGGNIAGGYK